MTQLNVYSPGQVSDVMDALGQTPWRINKEILEVMKEVKRQDLALGEIPPRHDPEVPIVEPEMAADPAAFKVLMLKRSNALKQVRELQSARPTFELKLQVAESFVNAPALYFPHNVDFRGRAYPIPPHLNHIGDDVCRGLLKFATPKPLGKDGLFWLKVDLCNLLGKNKIPFSERIEYVDSLREQIIEVARDPLNPSVRDLWVKADDGPWQTLARCMELAQIYTTDVNEEFLSWLPVHLDGSCNGLQHYAALGRDEWGGKAVNLMPSDRPQDVYSVVLEIVKQKVQKECEAASPEQEMQEIQEADEEESEEAKTKRRLKDKGYLAQRAMELGLLQRKVVKQTIMTICYGVTAVGAKKQVQSQLEDMIGETVEAPEVRALAGYLSKHVLKSIDEVFSRAMLIKRWFDSVSANLNQLEVPTTWISPIGLVCAQPYKKVKQVHVVTKRQKVTLNEDDGPRVDKVKQRMGFPPNFIHSLDASHMMLSASAAKSRGIFFAGVHDSFWTHACDAPILNEIIRDAFVKLHGQPILENFREEMRVHLGGVQPPALPQQGTLDLALVRESLYVFH